MLPGGRQLLQGHLQAAVAREADHRAVGMFEISRRSRRATRSPSSQNGRATCRAIATVAGRSDAGRPRSCPPRWCRARGPRSGRRPRRTTSSILTAPGGFLRDLPGLVIGAGGGGSIAGPESDHWLRAARPEARGRGRRGWRWAGRRCRSRRGRGGRGGWSCPARRGPSAYSRSSRSRPSARPGSAARPRRAGAGPASGSCRRQDRRCSWDGRCRRNLAAGR